MFLHTVVALSTVLLTNCHSKQQNYEKQKARFSLHYELLAGVVYPNKKPTSLPPPDASTFATPPNADYHQVITILRPEFDSDKEVASKQLHCYKVVMTIGESIVNVSSQMSIGVRELNFMDMMDIERMSTETTPGNSNLGFESYGADSTVEQQRERGRRGGLKKGLQKWWKGLSDSERADVNCFSS
jgi:hypothetical protein